MRVLFMGQQVTAKQRMAYYLLAEEDEREIERYGVRIQSEAGEQDEVLDVTGSGRDAVELAELLIRNTVTPVTLRDVVEDWLAR